MKKVIAMLVVFCFLGVPMSSFAAKGGKKGPAGKAYEKADDNAKFKRDNLSEDIDKKPKKKRKRIEAEEGEDKGQGQQKGKKEKKRKEGAQDD